MVVYATGPVGQEPPVSNYFRSCLKIYVKIEVAYLREWLNLTVRNFYAES